MLCRLGQVCGIRCDGGWTEYAVVPAEAVAALPDNLSADESSPYERRGTVPCRSYHERHSKEHGVAWEKL
ncbi:MAG: hypothetical protein CV090_12315 [Nitrospira sp. WS238]|nr:hypothetical protein [Nitrospira sp. WS238]